MTTLPEHMIRIEALRSRVTRVNSLYGRAYGPLCLLALTLTFFPYYESEPHSSITHGNVWQEVLRLGPGFDLMALLLVILTATLLAVGAVRGLPISGLIAIIVGSVLIGSTLCQSPGYVEPPPYTNAGVLDIALSFLAAGLALAHAVHLFILELSFHRSGD